MTLREWARRHAREAGPGAARDPLAGRGDEAAARASGDRPGDVARVCDGTACHFGGAAALRERLAGRVATGAVRCLGHCYDAPAVCVGDVVYSDASRAAFGRWLADPRGPVPAPAGAAPIPRMSLAEPPVLLRDLLAEPRLDIDGHYDLPAAEDILDAVEAYGLRGRGGAAAPTAAKWESARDTGAPDRIVVANGDEGDPSSFVDRLLLEEAPHAILSGMVACARVVGARTGIVYIRAEYPLALRVMREAVQAARSAGHLGDAFDVEVVAGAGSYVCGEESALLGSIEGRDGAPRIEPPFPAVSELWGLPAVVQDVETLAIASWLVRSGHGHDTKLVSLAGAVDWPGVVEVPLGTPLRRLLIEGGGGAPPGRRWRMAVIGGPLGRVLPERRFDMPLAYDTLPGMGHGGIVVLDDTVTPAALARYVFHFAQAESCGSCASCRVATPLLARARDRAELERLLDTLERESRCGFGRSVSRPVRDLLEHFGDEVLA